MKAKRICRVCGKEYDYCYTIRKDSSIFRWQDVACCPEHGSVYFARVMQSRATPKEVEPELEETTAEQESCDRVQRDTKANPQEKKARRKKECTKKENEVAEEAAEG